MQSSEREPSRLRENNHPAEYTEEQKGTIVAYLQEISKLKPAGVRDWDALRHSLYFVYRQLISPDPAVKNVILPTAMRKEIRDLIEG